MAEEKQSKKAVKQMKTDVETVKTNLKSGRDLEKMETLVRKHLNDSLFQGEVSLYALLADVVKKQYEAGNEKMYLKAKVDTASLMKTGRRMFLACMKLDSLDAKPNEKGVSSPAYRKRNAEYLAPYRNNIFKGGLYFFAHGDWKEAWNMFDTYLDCHNKPLFEASKLDSINDHYAAYVAVVSANNFNNLSMATKYEDMALKYEPAKLVTLTILSELCRQHNDTARYIKYLKHGFRFSPYSGYFFPHLIDYYTEKSDYVNALKYTDEALAKDSLNELFVLAKHSILMDTKQYDDALEYGERLLEKNDSIEQPNYNVGYILYLRAQEAMKMGGVPYRQRMANAQKYYKQCKPYMERYRRLRPKEVKRWKPVLYDVYLNLNMGKEFAELENVDDKEK